MHNVDPSRNCHSYCEFGRMCRYETGAVGRIPEDCSMYYKLDDIRNDSYEEEIEEGGGEEW